MLSVEIAKNLGKAVPKFQGPNMALFVTQKWHISSPISKLSIFILLYAKKCPPKQIWSYLGNKQGFFPVETKKSFWGPNMAHLVLKDGIFCPQSQNQAHLSYYMPKSVHQNKFGSIWAVNKVQSPQVPVGPQKIILGAKKWQFSSPISKVCISPLGPGNSVGGPKWGLNRKNLVI